MALKINSGDFNKRISFKQPAKVKNNEGGTEKDFTVAFTTWAAERKVDQKRVFESGGSDLLDTRFLYIRYAESRKVIDKDWLVNIDGVDYTIHSKPTVQESGLKVFEIIAKGKHNG